MNVVYDSQSGELIGYGVIADYPNATNGSQKEVADVYLTPVHWDVGARDFVQDSQPNLELDVLDFLQLFSSSERIQIEGLAESDSIIRDILFLLNHANKVHLNNPLVINALDYFESLSIVTTERKNQILGGG